MPYLCCVPGCKSNYPGYPKASCFSFPKDLQEQEKWARAIKRENFRPTKASRVCELHFRPHEIERVASFYVERTGELLTAPLKNPRVAKDAVPSKLPGCSTYRSKKQKANRSRKKATEEKKECLSLRVCRTCLAHNDLYLIDNVNREGLDLKEIIENWTPLKLKKNEKLPRKMCQRCINDMYQTYQFLLKCKKSEETLKRYFYQGIQNELNEQVLVAKNSEMEVCENNTYKKNDKAKSDSENVGNIHSDIHYTEDLSDVGENNTYKKNKAKSDSKNVGDIHSDIHYTGDLSDVDENNTYKKNNKAKSDSENVGDIHSDIHYTGDLYDVDENNTYKKNNKAKSDSENVGDIHSDIHYTADLSDVGENNTYKKNNKAKSDSENVGDIHSDIHYTEDLSDVGENNTYKKNKAKSDSKNVDDIHSDIHNTEDLSDVGENNTYKKNKAKSDSENVGDIHSDMHYTEDLSDVEDSKELISLVFDDKESEKGENTNTLSRITNIKIEFEENEVIDNEIKTTNDEQTVHNDNLTDLVNKELKNDVGDDKHKKDNANVLFDIANDQTEIKQIEVKNNSMKRRRLKAQLIDKKHLSKSKNISYVFLKGPPYICITCDASFQSYKELRKHKTETNHKSLSKFLCPYCNKKHDSYSTHVEHVRTHTGEKPNKCSICGKCFNLKCVFKRHMLTHLEVKPHSCTVCNKQFTRRQYLTDHERKHTGEKLICSFCGKVFSSYGLLCCHEKTHRAPPGSDNKSNKSMDPVTRAKLFQCHVCGKELRSDTSLKAHLRLLHGPRNFICEICERAYVSKKHLEDHIRISHQGIKHFCNVCDKAYTRENDLKSHMKSHLGPNVYPCELCEKTYTYKHSLVQHKRIHTGDTKYQCKECLRIFVSKRNLDQHMRVHTGDKPFVCNFCGKMFAQMSNMYAHMKIHTGEKNHACEICGKAFYRVRVLNKHLTTHAKNKEL